MIFRFCRYDAGAKARNWDTGDCTVRAVSTALELPYTQAWHMLYKLQGEHQCCRFAIFEFLRRNPDRFNVVRKISCKAVRGQKRTTGRTFALAHPQGRYILRLAHHAVAVVDGVYYDSWLSDSKCVYCAWEVRV